jgi:hypothetical protein
MYPFNDTFCTFLRALDHRKVGNFAAFREAANIVLAEPLKGCTALKSYAMKVARLERDEEGQGGASVQSRGHHGSNAGR